MLGATADQIYYGSLEKGYACCLIGCRFVADRHLNYVKHIKQSHPNMKNLLCNFRKLCLQRFDSVENLVQHLKENHSARVTVSSSKSIATDQVNVAVKCNRLLCNGRQFDNLSLLMTHWNCFHSNENRDCIFLDCNSTFDVRSTSRQHFRTQHKLKNKMELKQRHLVQGSGILHIGGLATSSNDPASLAAVGAEGDGHFSIVESADYDDEHFALLETFEEDLEDKEDTEEKENYYLKYYADYLNRLTTFKYVPASTVQEMAEEYLSNTTKSLERREHLLRKSLGKINGIDQAEVERVVKEVIHNDQFLDAQIKLSTDYKRKKFIKENMSYVAPQEIVMNKQEVKEGKRKEVVHYIPVTETFKTLVEDPTMIKMMNLKTAGKNVVEDNKLHDLRDGSVFKTNEFFVANPEAFTVMLYSDGVEIKNPLGAAKGRYKVIQVFYTLGEVDKAQRSQIDRITLGMF